jgi:hypothetical protein
LKATASVTPPVHEYEAAPLPESVTGEPEQTEEAVEFATTVGSAFTVTVVMSVLVQPFASVPVTV